MSKSSKKFLDTAGLRKYHALLVSMFSPRVSNEEIDALMESATPVDDAGVTVVLTRAEVEEMVENVTTDALAALTARFDEQEAVIAAALTDLDERIKATEDLAARLNLGEDGLQYTSGSDGSKIIDELKEEYNI